MRKYAVEFIGTFFLVLTIGTTVINSGKTGEPPNNAGNLAPLAIGAALMVMVYAGGHVSGAHYNPAVTLGVWIRGRCDTKDVAPYMIAQVVGALAAAVLVLYLKGNPTVKAATPPLIPALIVEFLFTFALVYVVLNVATSKETAGNSYYGLAIGFTVLAGAFAVGPISGGAFNPAVAAGITAMGLNSLTNVWIHLVGDFLGGAAAGLAFRALNPNDP